MWTVRAIQMAGVMVDIVVVVIHNKDYANGIHQISNVMDSISNRTLVFMDIHQTTFTGMGWTGLITDNTMTIANWHPKILAYPHLID